MEETSSQLFPNLQRVLKPYRMQVRVHNELLHMQACMRL
jgi:hypothetical protein